jgi:VanZ family protein
MAGELKQVSNTTTAGCLCCAVLGIILVAGLWPFHAPRNAATWLEGRNGILFGHHGTLLSAGGFPSETTNSSGTIEVWLDTDLATRKKTILTFDGSAHPGEPFSLQQDKDALLIRRHNIDNLGVVRTAMCEVGGVFTRGQAVFLSVTLADRQTFVYVNGVPAKTCGLAASANNLSGRLVVANSAMVNNSWPGKIFGIAIYRGQLSTSEVAGDYEAWTKTGKPAPPPAKGPVALYLFDEHAGAVVHNQMNGGLDLEIPERYLLLHPEFLEPFWREYRPRWSYWADVGVNIAGFIPFGFCFAAYFYSLRKKKTVPPALVVLLLGFAVSLTIEVLQSWLPTRSSGTTDLITNTLGTGIGLMLYRWRFTQRLLAGMIGHGSATP